MSAATENPPLFAVVAIVYEEVAGFGFELQLSSSQLIDTSPSTLSYNSSPTPLQSKLLKEDNLQEKRHLESIFTAMASRWKETTDLVFAVLMIHNRGL
ncbi:MAG: hypothetical protein Q9213_001714 [Squamulea squamosa]